VPEKLPAPYDLRVDVVSHGATAYWQIDRAKTDRISGYNIYLTLESLKDKFVDWEKDHPAPHNFSPYPGDTDGDRSKESYEITGLENGRAYYVSVRTVEQGGRESNPSNEVEFTPLARGVFVISSNHSAEIGGFNFESESSMPARDLRCDIYLYAKGDTIGLSSPGRLGAGLRKTYFSRPGIINIREMDSIRISENERITATGKFGRAELTVRKINLQGADEAEATLEYIFYPAPPEAGK